MYLTLDIGNTRIKFVRWNLAGEISESGGVDELWQIPSIIGDTKSICYCNVRDMKTFKPDSYNGKLVEISANMKLPVKLEYKTPETLGQDRLAAILGAFRLYPKQNVLIVDAGTCIKFDLLTAEGIYKGGSISPGLMMRYRSLNHYTGKLPEVSHRQWNEAWGNNTEESILAGVQHGFVGEVDYRIGEFKEKYPDLKVIGTGGDMSFLADRLKYRIFAEPLIIHYGLLHCLLNP